MLEDEMTAVEDKLAGRRGSETVSVGGCRLSDLAVGDVALVTRLEGQRVFRRRLMELGLIPGVAVTVVNVAPLGDPIELEVRHCRLSVRRAEAAHILVSRSKRSLKVIA